jgi:hypothetical protein
MLLYLYSVFFNVTINLQHSSNASPSIEMPVRRIIDYKMTSQKICILHLRSLRVEYRYLVRLYVLLEQLVCYCTLQNKKNSLIFTSLNTVVTCL